MKPEVVVRADANVGEGPVFDERTGLLCWVDIVPGLLHQSDLVTGSLVTTEAGMMLGAAIPRATSPGFAVAVQDGFGFLVDEQLKIVDRALTRPDLRMNDAKCDSRGRLWAGSNGLNVESGWGSLHRWDGTSPSTIHMSGLDLPNGIGWSPDDRLMYLVDSVAGRLMVSKFEADEGHIEGFTTLVAIRQGLPDGLAVGADGSIFLAIWGGSEVRRYSPDGTLMSTIAMPVAQPSSCAFGADGILYITSARANLSDEQLASQPLAGSIFAVQTDTTGAPIWPFAH